MELDHGRYMLPWKGFDINHPSRFARAVRDINRLLADGDWRRWGDVERLVLEDTGLTKATVSNLLSTFKQAGDLEYEYGQLRLARAGK